MSSSASTAGESLMSSSSDSSAVQPVESVGAQRNRAHSKHDITALTPQQKEALSVMRDKISSHPLGAHDTGSDYTHLRFLRARKFDVDAAVEMYIKQLKWRKDAGVDTILTNPPTELRKVLSTIVPEAFHKFDRHGLPAYWMKAGAVNPDLLLKYVTVDDMVTTHLWGQEYSFARAAEKSVELGRNIDQFVNIVDLAGLTMSHRQCLKYMKTITALDQQYYPESLGKTFVINAPWIFPALWKLVKVMLDPVTAEKVTVLGGNYKDVLRERFELKDLPAEYGGECRCQGGCIPVFTEQQAVAVVMEAERDLHLEEVTLAAGQSHTVKMVTGEYGGTFTYYWKSYKADVGFQAVFTPSRPSARAVQQQQQQQQVGLHHRRKSSAEAKAAEASAAASSSSSSVVSEVRECPYGERVWQAHEKFACQQPHKGRLVTDYAGAAVFTFDNKHSWRHAEKMAFTIRYEEGKPGISKEAAQFTALVPDSPRGDTPDTPHQ